MRKEIEDFANEMEQVMKRHDELKGSSWKTCDLEFLEQKRAEEHREYNSTGNPRELVDEANILMMLWNRRFESGVFNK